MPDAAPVTPRIVPGAPPPPPLTKSQKKKRKTGKGKDDEPAVDAILDLPTPRSAALIAEAPTEAQAVNGVASGLVAPSLVASNEDKEEHIAGEGTETKKPSPSVEAVAKKLKSITKKIQRIATYAHLPPAQLNEDQRRTAATLPALELAAKELEEVKKNVEIVEAERVKHEAQARTQEEDIVKQRIAEAVAEAQVASVSVASRVVAFIRLSHVVSSEPSITTASLSESERNAIFVASQYLLGEVAEQRDAVVAGFFSGEGEIEGVDYSRLRQILDDHLSEPAAVEPADEPRSPTPVAADGEPVPDDLHIPPAETIPPTASGASSFHFMQASELEGTTFEQGAEWVEKPEEPTEPVVENGVVASYEPAAVETPVAEPAGPIDWANDDGGLPEIESLQAKFGSSGQATPSAPQEPPVAETWTPAQEPAAEPAAPPTTNGHTFHQNAPPPVDDDGFTEARRPRTVSARGGDRGFRGRGFRGGDRGGPRGGRPDGERGRGGFRGGDRGRGGGEYRGGEYRGRGRGGDRGGYRGRGAAPTEV